jgi:hypothetical protein
VIHHYLKLTASNATAHHSERAGARPATSEEAMSMIVLDPVQPLAEDESAGLPLAAA